MMAIASTVMPHADPVPLPGPAWLMWFLLLLTFFLHLLPMNLILGGSVIGALAHRRGRRQDAPHHRELAAWLGKAMPVAVAATVTTGVAPLLFLQVLYGRLFFTSTILMGWFWMAVIVLLIVGYYGTYVVSFRRQREDGGGGGLRWLVTLLFLSIGFFITNNMTLMLRPGTFVNTYLASARGFHLNFGDPSLIPRYLHNVIGALAVAGMVVAILGLVRRRKQPEFGGWALRYGSLWFVVATGLNMVVGFILLVTLPRDTLMRFMGQDLVGTIALSLGFMMAVGALVMMLLATQRDEPAGLMKGSVWSLLLTLVAMVLVRDQVRQGALEAAGFEVQAWVVPQWGPILIFAVLLVTAIALVAWMVGALVRVGDESRGA
jgi:hypothetical protein